MRSVLLLVTLLFGCGQDETISRFADAGIFKLSEIDGTAFTADATLDVGTPGTVRGTGPCNSFSAMQTAPYPWIDIGPISATRRACEQLPQEQIYFSALGAMTIAETLGPVLLLSNDEGRQMVFYAR